MDAFSRSLAAATLVDGKGFALPGIGSIEGRYVPARIDHVRRVVEPPFLDLYWSSPAIATIPTFATLLVRTGATPAEADALQQSWLEELAAGHSIAIGDFGELQRVKESDQVTFVRNEAGLERVYWGSGAVEVEPLPRRSRPSSESASQSPHSSILPAVVASIPPPSSATPISPTPQTSEGNQAPEQPAAVERVAAEGTSSMASERSEALVGEAPLGLSPSSSSVDSASPLPLAGSSDHKVSAQRAEGPPVVQDEGAPQHLSSERSRVETADAGKVATPTSHTKSLHQVLAKAEDQSRSQSTGNTPVPPQALRSSERELSEIELEEDEGPAVASYRDSLTSALPAWWRYAAIGIGALLSWVILRQILGPNSDAEESGRALTISQDRLNRSPLDEDGGPVEGEGVVSEDFVAPSYNPKYGPSSGERSARIDDEGDRYATLDVPVVPTPVPQMRAPADTRSGVGAATPVSPGTAGYSGGTGRPPVTTPTNGASKSPARVAPPKVAPGFDPASLAGAPAKSGTGAGNGEVEVVIILGSFSDAINAGRLTERLAADGLLPFVDQPGKLTRVGVSFTASKAREVDRMLERMQRDYNPNAWVLE